MKERSYEKVREALLKGAESVELILIETTEALISAWKEGMIEEKHLKSAVQAMKLLSGTNIKFHPKKDLLESCFEIAMKENLSVYDTVYIALASKLKLPILTLDSSRLEVARRNKVKIAEISDI